MNGFGVAQRMHAVLAATAATVLMAGCGGSDEPPAQPPAPPRVSATIGAAGGTLTGPDGVQMVVPAGAVAQDTVFSIARVTSGMPALPTDYAASTPLYEFTPHDTPFAQPVTVRMPYTAPTNALHADAFMANPGGDWQPVRATIANGVAQWQRLSLSYGGALWCVSSGTPDPYMCVWPTLGLRVAATPTGAYADTVNAFGVRVASVSDAVALQFTLDASAARDCSASTLRVFRRNGTAPATTAFSQNIALGADPNNSTRAVGSATFNLALDRPDNGPVFLTFSFRCTRPGKAESGASVQMQIGVNVPPPPATAPPVVTTQPASQTVTAPAAATFSAAASGTPAPTVQWQQSTDNGANWTNIAGATASSYSTGPTAAADSGRQFRAVFTNSAGSARSNAAVLTVAAPSNATVVQVSAGETFSCARHVDGAVRCWGFGGEGSLGYEDTQNRGDAPGQMGASLPVVRLGTGRTAQSIASGYRHSCALLDNGRLKCWGVNTYGQVGVVSSAYVGGAPGDMGDNLPAVDLGTGVSVQAVALGGLHSCALLNGGRVKCWGSNDRGALGVGDTLARGLGPGDLGDNLPFVNLGTGRTAVALSLGRWHSCAILDNGSVKCWGNGSFGALGIGEVPSRGDLPSHMGDNLQAVPLGTGRTAVALASGQQWSCALLDNASVKCWGDNTWGQLGRGDLLAFTATIAQMGDALPAVALGAGRTATALHAGRGHVCARLDNGQVKCWGLNDYGMLGLGDVRSRGRLAADLGDSLPAVDLGTGRTPSQFAAGGERNCVLLDNGAVKCWGNGTWGLGLGDTLTRGDEPGEMGDALPALDLSR